jgi:hypothetical protein
MKVAPIIIERFATWLIGGVPFQSAKRIVAALNDKDMSNTAKRYKAVSELESLGYEIGELLVNLAIELAVAWLKSKAK